MAMLAKRDAEGRVPSEKIYSPGKNIAPMVEWSDSIRMAR